MLHALVFLVNVFLYTTVLELCSSWNDVLQEGSNASIIFGTDDNWRFAFLKIQSNKWFDWFSLHSPVLIFCTLLDTEAGIAPTGTTDTQGFHLFPESRAQADLKFTYVVTCQIYGKQKEEQKPEAADIALLMQRWYLFIFDLMNVKDRHVFLGQGKKRRGGCSVLELISRPHSWLLGSTFIVEMRLFELLSLMRLKLLKTGRWIKNISQSL